MTRLAAYLSIVKGTPRVRRISVQAAAALVAASTSIESSNPELRVSVQLSGVSATGTTSWVSLFGSGRLCDPAVLRVQSHIHHYARGVIGLLQAGNSLRCEEAHIVGDYAGGDLPVSSPERPGRPPRGAVDSTHEEYLEAMTSPADSCLQPPPGILEEVRELQRATVGAGDVVELDRSLEGGVPPEALFPRGPLYNGVDLNAPAASASADSSRLGDGSGSIQGGETAARRSRSGVTTSALGESGGVGAANVGPLLSAAATALSTVATITPAPLLIESYEPPPAHVPTQPALEFINALLSADTTPARTMRAALKSAIFFITAREGTVTRKIMACLGGWWPFVLVSPGQGPQPSPNEQWQFGVVLPARLMSNTRRSRKASSQGTVVHVIDRVPSNDSHATQNDVIASIVLL